MEKYVRVFTKDGRSIGLDRHLGPPASYDCIIYRDGDYVVAKNGRTGEEGFREDDVGEVVTHVAEQLELGGLIYIARGIYDAYSPLTLKPGVSLIGSGWATGNDRTKATVIKRQFDGNLIEYKGSDITRESFRIENIMIDGNAENYSGDAIYVDTAKNFIINKVWVINNKGAGVHIKSSGLHWIVNSRFSQMFYDGNTPAIIYEENSGDYIIANNDLGTLAGDTELQNLKGIYCHDSGSGRVIGNKIYNVHTGIEVTKRNIIVGNWINDFYKYGIASASDYVQIVANTLTAIELEAAGTNSTGILLTRKHNVVTGNVIDDELGIYTWGIKEGSSADYNIIANNKTNLPYQIQGVHTYCDEWQYTNLPTDGFAVKNRPIHYYDGTNYYLAVWDGSTWRKIQLT